MMQALHRSDPFLTKPQTLPDYPQDLCEEMNSSSWESFVCVSTEKPYRLMDVSQEWLDLFQFSREEVVGRALRLIGGPATNNKELTRLIEKARDGKEAQGTVYFYSSSGIGKLITMKLFPASSSSESCIIEMRASDAISIPSPKVADEIPNFGGNFASVILSAEAPNSIHRANENFCAMFGCTLQMALNRTLRFVYGPKTNAAQLTGLLNNARSGFSQTGEVRLYSIAGDEFVCTVRVVPIVSADGEMTQLLVSFTRNDSARQHHEDVLRAVALEAISQPAPSLLAPHQQHRSAFNNTFEPDHSELDRLTTSMETSLAIAGTGSFQPTEHRLPSVHQQAPMPTWEQRQNDSAPTFHDLPSPATVAPSGNTSPCPDVAADISRQSSVDALPRTESGGASLRLIPRKKGAVSSPVQLSVQLLKDMGVMSMRKAAEELGIAPSTLKKACRKLGMKRWIHSPAAAPIQQHAMDYNSAYVRSLHTKYAPKRPTPVPASPDSENGWGDAATPGWHEHVQHDVGVFEIEAAAHTTSHDGSMAAFSQWHSGPGCVEQAPSEFVWQNGPGWDNGGGGWGGLNAFGGAGLQQWPEADYGRPVC